MDKNKDRNPAPKPKSDKGGTSKPSNPGPKK